ncbi:hypothetical protein DTO207G8_8953 [Paecilomyces variotii]|nr:hypothetical protein DTO207G8_8953 [Paecilomyces variotii]KAJ9291945.1 hypothetical protein DTO021C3_385 [Paecilomyces variotii]KAJ9306446.1 hypothetical protein DTO217A2_3992 [Paecilomyces variotii]KAJ9396155.1 hypothetical protein DTO282F9_6998 [Paecilomyces variotii]
MSLYFLCFPTSPGLLGSPLDSCNSGSSSTSPISASSLAFASLSNVFSHNVTSTESFPPVPASAYSHSTGFSWNERAPDFRHRVPALHPPAGMSTSLESQAAAAPVNPTLIGRGEAGFPAYTVGRGSFASPHSSFNDMSRYPHYTTTPRALDNSIDRAANTIYNAPPFHSTNVIHSIVTPSHSIKPEIQARIHKGFFQVDQKWTCYRRNYFSLSCSFSLPGWAPNTPLYIQLPNHTTEPIHSFSMSISAIVNAQDGEVRELVQHTPKRDKQSETRPGKVTLQPQPVPSLLGHGSATGLCLGTSSRSVNMSMDFGSPYATVGQSSQPPTQHTFERIQFQRATANNGKRRAQQQYYNLVVELYAEVPSPLGSTADTQWVKIARRISEPMVVRGRSPGHYKDGRRDSSTSMGPDGRTGGSEDGKGGAVLPSGIGHGARSNLPLMSYDHSRRGGSHYGRSDYRQMAPIDHPSLNDSPLISSSSSSAVEFPFLNDPMEPMEGVPSGSYPEQAFSSSSEDRRSECQFAFAGPSAMFNYDALSHNRDHTEASFRDSFDSVAAALQDDRVDPRRLKRSHRDIHTIFDGPYNRLDARASSRRLCA